ncbi:MAG: hypothetical protein P4M08_15360 [Oligoflexia bacterium]|nr:hypothetical protein [Oligoflexia bacterium]
MFNVLKYTEELEKAGFSRSQAEMSMKVLIDVMNENFATKSDLAELGFKFEKLESKVESSMRELEYRLTIKLGTMLTLAIGVTATLVKLLGSIH